MPWMSFWHMVDLEQNAAKRARVGDNDQDHDVETKIVNELIAFCTGVQVVCLHQQRHHPTRLITVIRMLTSWLSGEV